MRVTEIMTGKPACVTPTTSLADAAKLMQDRNVGMLPVLDGKRSNKLVGVVTDRDITIRHVAAGHRGDACTVREAMTDRVTTCRPDEELGDVMNAMGRERVRRIPVVDERGTLVGVVSQADLVLHANDAGRVEHTIEQISAP